MDLWSKLKSDNKPILLYGMGDGADKILSVLNGFGISIQGVFVSDAFVRNKVFHGYKLMSFTEAQKQFKDFIALVAFGTSRPDVLDNINSVSKNQQLYVPDVPVAGKTLFDYDFFKKNEEKIRYVYNKLETELDRYIYESVIRYKLTGRPHYLHRSYQTKDEMYDRLKFKDDYVCVDCGAFTGDTVKELLSYNPECEKIYAIEPDCKTFKKLESFASSDNRIIPINAAVSNNSKGVVFNAIGNRGSKEANIGVTVKSVYIDNLMKGDRVNYIKFDVEGMESIAIEGAIETIKKYKPKMLVSCYHRSEDIFELPIKVLNIRNDYKLHIYHPKYLPAWDTAFLFV